MYLQFNNFTRLVSEIDTIIDEGVVSSERVYERARLSFFSSNYLPFNRRTELINILPLTMRPTI